MGTLLRKRRRGPFSAVCLATIVTTGCGSISSLQTGHVTPSDHWTAGFAVGSGSDVEHPVTPAPDAASTQALAVVSYPRPIEVMVGN